MALLSAFMVRVRSDLVLDGLQRTEARLEVDEGERDMRAPERRDDLDFNRDAGLRAIEPEQCEPLQLVGGEVGDRIVILGVVRREPVAVPVRLAAQEGLRLPPVGLRVGVVAADHDHLGAGGELTVSQPW